MNDIVWEVDWKSQYELWPFDESGLLMYRRLLP